MNSFQNRSCIETKILLTGAIHQYPCMLLHHERTFGILRYVIDREYYVNSMHLVPGNITYALYWTARPYTLYIWPAKETTDAAYYFNIADRIILSASEFQWRDLTVDILIDTAGLVHILDEDELPHDLPANIQHYILAAKAHVLTHYRDIIIEADSLVKKFIS